MREFYDAKSSAFFDVSHYLHYIICVKKIDSGSAMSIFPETQSPEKRREKNEKSQEGSAKGGARPIRVTRHMSFRIGLFEI